MRTAQQNFSKSISKSYTAKGTYFRSSARDLSPRIRGVASTDKVGRSTFQMLLYVFEYMYRVIFLNLSILTQCKIRSSRPIFFIFVLKYSQRLAFNIKTTFYTSAY